MAQKPKDPPVVVITGATAGVGRAVTHRFARDGARIGLIARGMPNGDILGFAPPLIITLQEVDQLVDMAKKAVDKVASELGR